MIGDKEKIQLEEEEIMKKQKEIVDDVNKILQKSDVKICLHTNKTYGTLTMITKKEIIIKECYENEAWEMIKYKKPQYFNFINKTPIIKNFEETNISIMR